MGNIFLYVSNIVRLIKHKIALQNYRKHLLVCCNSNICSHLSLISTSNVYLLFKK